MRYFEKRILKNNSQFKIQNSKHFSKTRNLNPAT
jgi:hypothetical protein